MFNKAGIFAVTALALVLAAPAAQADDNVPPAKCALTELASLPLTIGESKIAMPTAPVSVAGASGAFVVGLAQPYTAVTQAFAEANKIETQPVGRRSAIPFAIYSGRLAEATAVIPALSVGHLAISNAGALVLSPSRDIDGILGLDILSRTDVELNLSAQKVNLFSQDHCAGQAVYWGRSFTTLPMAFDEKDVPVFQMQLDGKPVTVKLDVTKDEATMGRDQAQTLFGITSQTPGLTPRTDIEMVTVTRGRQSVPDADALKNYDYVFKDLSVNGIDIHGLKVLLTAQPFPDACKGASQRQVMALNPDQCNGGVDLVLGRNELRAMRLFFSFKEKMLYVTGADPSSSPPAGPVH